MAQLSSRCNLSAARFPLATSLQGRTIILPQHDMNFQKSAVFAGADADRDVGVPQCFYCHNVMPTENGIQSVGFSTLLNPYIPAVTDFDQAFPLFDATGNKFLFSPGAGKNYVFDAPVTTWASCSPIAGLPSTVLVTTAFVQGQSYVYYANKGCYKYNSVTKAMDVVALGGLVAANIRGIVGSNGYLIAWDANTIYWSSATNPLDFVPSLLTGAGSLTVTDLKGIIVVCLPSINGFIVYGTVNAVGASFSSNIRFPFIFKEIAGCGGIRSKEHVSYEANLEDHYALTSAGLQTVNKTAAKTILPEASDFITSRIFEDFDSVTNTFALSYLTSDLRIKLTIISERYLVLSYGVSLGVFTHALIYDIVMKRWGKVKINHVDCFQYPYPNLYGLITYAILLAYGTRYDELFETTYLDLSTTQTSAEKPRRTLAFLQSDGTVKVTTFDLGALNHDAVYLLGKFQFTRGHHIQLQEFDVEVIDTGSNFSAWVLPSWNGKQFQPAIAAYLQEAAGLVNKYKKRVTGENITLLFKGSFDMVSTQIVYNQHGVR